MKPKRKQTTISPFSSIAVISPSFLEHPPAIACGIVSADGSWCLSLIDAEFGERETTRLHGNIFNQDGLQKMQTKLTVIESLIGALLAHMDRVYYQKNLYEGIEQYRAVAFLNSPSSSDSSIMKNCLKVFLLPTKRWAVYVESCTKTFPIKGSFETEKDYIETRKGLTSFIAVAKELREYLVAEHTKTASFKTTSKKRKPSTNEIGIINPTTKRRRIATTATNN